MNIVFQEIYKTVWKEVFPNIKQLPIDKFKSLFTFDINLPKKYLCERTKKEVFISDNVTFKRFIHEDVYNDDRDWDEISGFSNFDELLKKIKPLALFRGNKILNSEVVEESDNIYSSNYVHNSQNIFQGQKVLFSEHCFESQYLLASKNSGGSSFSIRITDCNKSSNSFDVDWSDNIVNSYFIHGSSDLRDCMFCFHLRSKQYCIGNKQFTKEEYFKFKEIILKEYFEQLDKPGAFVTLKDL